jgi:hypothetical protein
VLADVVKRGEMTNKGVPPASREGQFYCSREQEREGLPAGHDADIIPDRP